MDPEVVKLPVQSPQGSYDVVVGHRLLGRVSEFAQAEKRRAAIITDKNVGPHHLESLGNFEDGIVLMVEPGEQHKNLETVRYLYDSMLEAGLDRSTAVVALGGGVINDMAGFVAATYMRGVDFITCPTSLLAMVDASIGGKTGVDLPQGKNLIGAFKQPKVVVADLHTLSTLPLHEFSAGMAEVIKSGLIADPNLFMQVSTVDWLSEIRNGDLVEFRQQLQGLVADSIRVKRDIVEEDPYESGKRAWLNLGHTFGHAFEQVSGYNIRHGEGVAMGLVCAAHLSHLLGYAAADLQLLIERALRHVDLPTRIPRNLETSAILEAMRVDKKVQYGKLRFILLRGVGDVFVANDVPQDKVIQTLNSLRVGARS